MKTKFPFDCTGIFSKEENYMRIINPSVTIEDDIDEIKILKSIEKAGRTCYKSENNITADSAKNFVDGIIRKGHESVLEHEKVTVRFICDRGASHEIVRHRLASYSQESSRYCNYSKEKFGNELTFIKPIIFNGVDLSIPKYQDLYIIWENAMKEAEKYYISLINAGAKTDLARGVLPTDIKTEIVMTANLREWRHFLKMRRGKASHPNIRYLANELLKQFTERIPVIFDDINF